MNPQTRTNPKFWLVCEYLLLMLVLASVVWVAQFFFNRHYLPQPFVFDVNDTFMDWFNTALYAHQPGAFDVWRTVYPPLSFVFLRLFSISSCYGDPFFARDCDWIGTVTILLSYVADCVLAALAFRRRDRTTALPRSLAFAFGLPLLFALERGNLILVCLIPFILAYGDMLGSRFSRALAIAITINFKPYLLVPSLALAVKRNWRDLEMAGVATIAVYLITLAWFGSGTPLEILDNTRNWVTYINGQFWTFNYLSTSYSTLLMIADTKFPILQFVSSNTFENLMWSIPIIISSTQIAALSAVIAAWVQPRAIPLSRNVALLTGAHLATQSPGGYTFVFLIFPVFLEKVRRPGQAIALIAAYALSFNYDIVIATVVDTVAKSWLSAESVHIGFGLAIGQFVRPGLVILTVWSLAIDSIILSVQAHRQSRPSLGLGPAADGLHV